MSDAKSRGRPKKADGESSEAPKRSANSAESNGTPAKRGRGRPPKGSRKKAPYVKKK